LCGSFNANIIRKTAEQLKNPKNISRQRMAGKNIESGDALEVEVVGIGNKGAEFAKKMNYNLIASYSNLSDTPVFEEVLPIARTAVKDYEAKKYDKIVIAYTDYRSTVLQIAKLRQVLPVSEHDLEKMIYNLGNDVDNNPKDNKSDYEKIDVMEYLFEPNKKQVLSIVLPRLVETQIYQAVLESSASEHSARMMSMRNASDAAEDMIKELNINFNKARQAGITQEIAEIAGGAAALG
jgi:F-type H+-transporting ATPase subunit gamma